MSSEAVEMDFQLLITRPCLYTAGRMKESCAVYINKMAGRLNSVKEVRLLLTILMIWIYSIAFEFGRYDS